MPEQGKINRELWVEEDRRMWIMEDNILSCQEDELSEEMKRTDYIYMVSRKNMGRYKKIRDKGDISVVGADESIKRILLISGLHKIVYIYDNLMDAVKKENRRDV